MRDADAPRSYAPTVDWALARRVTRLGSRDLPERTLPELRQLVADLRVTARRAGEAGAEHLGLDSVGAATIRVVDWAGWGEAVRAMTDGVVADLGLPARAPGPVTTLRGLGSGLALGAGLRFASRRLLGQYDGYTGADTLYLVAPTIVRLERAHGFVPADFRMWVSLHEQTHALQFRAAPWLRDHLKDGARAVLDDESSLLEGLVGWARSGDAAAVVAGLLGVCRRRDGGGRRAPDRDRLHHDLPRGPRRPRRRRGGPPARADREAAEEGLRAQGAALPAWAAGRLP